MNSVLVRKSSLHKSEGREDLKGKSPQQLIDMMWPLALNAWAFESNLNAEPRVKRDIVVVRKRRATDRDRDRGDMARHEKNQSDV